MQSLFITAKTSSCAGIIPPSCKNVECWTNTCYIQEAQEQQWLQSGGAEDSNQAGKNQVSRVTNQCNFNIISIQSQFRLNSWIQANPEHVEALQRLEPESEPEHESQDQDEPSTSKGKGKGKGKRSKPARESPPKETEAEAEAESD